MVNEIISDSEATVDELKAALNQRSEELAVINSVQEALSKKIDIQGIYDLVGDKITKLFEAQAQAVLIATFNLESGTEHFQYNIEKGERFYPPSRPIDKLRSQLIETKEKIIINNSEESFSWFKEKVITGKPMKSGVFVPLLTADKITGYVSLQNVDYENAFTVDNIRLIETLANSMGFALENARLFDDTNRLLKETEQSKAELAVINSVQEGLVREINIQGIYNLVGDRIRELFNAQVVIIAAFDIINKLELFNYYIEKGEISYPKPRPFDKVRQHLITTAQNILINENFSKAAAEFGMKVVPGTEMPKSLLFMPMKVGEKVTGYVSLQNVDEENAFSFSDVRLLSTLSNSMSVALQNAKLFDETTRLLKETEQRKAELAVINSVQEGLAKELDMQGIYDLVGDRVQKLFNAQAVIISSFDLKNKTEQFNYLFENGEKVKADARAISKLRQTLIDKRRTIYIETEKQGQEDYGLIAIANTQMPKSLLFVPMLAGSEIRGYVSLQNIDKEHAFTDSDIRLLETLSNSMSVALENARLFDETNRLLKETEQRTAELAVINSVQEGLAKALDMQSIYDLVGNRIRDLFDAQVVGIATFDHGDETEHIHYLLEKGDRYYPAPRPLNMLRKHLIETKEKVLINTNFEVVVAAFGLKAVQGTQQPKSALYVPLVIGDKVTGYVSLQNLDKENAFSDSDVRLLETLANTMGVALENARLFDETTRLLKETEQQKAELGVINSVQEGLAKELDIQAIYDLVGNRIRELFKAQAVIIATFDHEAATEHFKYIIEDGQRFYLASRPYDKLRQHLIVAKQKIVINTNYEDAYAKFGLRILPGTNMTKSGVFVPLVIGDKVNSYISLQNNETENAFSESDVRLLETLANSMSVALENARLFDETNRLLKETEQRTAELAVINSVQEGLAKELDMHAIYELVGNKIQKVFNAQVVLICTFDHERGLEYFNYHIEKGEISYPAPRPYDKLRKTLIENREKIYINNLDETTAAKYSMKVVPGTELPKSLLFVPLLSGDKVKSYVSLQNIDKENAFSESDIRLLETLANSMSVALENARLFDETARLLKETEQRTAELAVINSVQEGLAHELDMQGIYNLVGDRVQKLFQTHAVMIASFDLENKLEHFNYVFENGVKYEIEPRPFNRLRQVLIDKKQTIYIETEEKAKNEYGITAIGETKMPKSLMFVPLLSGNNIKGYVSIQNVDQENAFSDSDIRLLETLANSMSVAHENARLFDETTHLLAEAKHRAAELSTVNSISKALASQLDADELIQFIGDQMKGLFKANIVYLAILNKKTQIINFPYQHGDDLEPIKLGNGLTSKIILTGEPLLVNKDVQEIRAQMGVQLIGIPAASYLGVPIPVGDEIIGVLSIQSTEQENRFNENDQRLLSTIAASVGVALNNATLFEDVKLAKMEAEAASKAAEKANEAKSAFLSTVSHELRTPLTSVLGFAKIIRKRLDEKIFPLVNREEPKTEKVVNQINENLKVVISEGERLTHLINDVLDLAKIEAGKMEWNVEDVSMSDVAERAIAATTSLFDQKSLKLEKKIEDDLPSISGDKDKLIQVMINLISNAVKFTESGSVSCKMYKKKNELITGITDTGIGIAPEDHAAVFEQFKQVGGDTLTDKPKGTGLGLPICKEIVEHHGGRIWLESKPGKGSTFYFALPLIKSIPSAKPVHLDKLLQQLKAQITQSPLNGIAANATILIVDDDDSIRSLLNQELSEAGYSVEEATNGKQALECVRKHKPDLIILDIMMPEMNGFDVAAILKNDPQTMDIPIIVLSIVQDKIRGYRIGVDRYLTKPIDTVKLFAEVGELLEQGKSKKKVMVVDEDSAAVSSLTEVLQAKGYNVVKSDGKELVEQAISDQPDIIILNSVHSDKQEVIQTLRFEKGLENVLFLIYG